MVVGHGVRHRQQAGPESLDGEPYDDEVPTRRYRCRACRAVIVVLPRGVLPRLRFRPAAVALALGLWALVGWSSGAVRKRVSPSATTATAGYRCWASLRRWLRTAPEWCGSEWGQPVPGSRQVRVEALFQQLASRCRDGTGTLLGDGVQAASEFHGHGGCAAREAASTS